MRYRIQLLKTAALALGMAFASQTAVAQEPLGSFSVFIGKPDLTNANGAALDAPWKVLRRDRENYHRYGVSQPGDEWDPYFGSSKNRNNLQAFAANGKISAQAAQRLATGGAVLVQVLGAGGVPSAIRVSVP